MNFDNAKYQPNSRIHIFYYGWYGTPEVNEEYMHWNHEILDDSRTKLKPPKDIGANFYPERGLYSSSDTNIIRKHMEELASIHVGVVVLSWYPPDRSDDQIKKHPGFCDSLVKTTLDEAEKVGIQVAFLLEPYQIDEGGGRKREKNAQDFQKDISYIIHRYKDHPAFYLYTKNSKSLPLIYVYDSYRTKSEEWRSLLGPKKDHPSSLRETENDAFVVGLALEISDISGLKGDYFDGVFTYFASWGFTGGSRGSNWKTMRKLTAQKGMIFIPSVGPGYDDTRIRPWNEKNKKERKGGEYYDRMFSSAINAIPDLISITSFNEWHEGTQIEPAASNPPHRRDYPYEKYHNNEKKGTTEDPFYYYERTSYWAGRF